MIDVAALFLDAALFGEKRALLVFLIDIASLFLDAALFGEKRALLVFLLDVATLLLEPNFIISGLCVGAPKSAASKRRSRLKDRAAIVYKRSV